LKSIEGNAGERVAIYLRPRNIPVPGESVEFAELTIAEAEKVLATLEAQGGLKSNEAVWAAIKAVRGSRLAPVGLASFGRGGRNLLKALTKVSGGLKLLQQLEKGASKGFGPVMVALMLEAMSQPRAEGAEYSILDIERERAARVARTITLSEDLSIEFANPNSYFYKEHGRTYVDTMSDPELIYDISLITIHQKDMPDQDFQLLYNKREAPDTRPDPFPWKIIGCTRCSASE